MSSEPRIEAEQWWPGREIPGVAYEREWVTEDLDGERRHREGAYVVTAHGQRVYLAPGDWVVPEPTGDGYYPTRCDCSLCQRSARPAAPTPSLQPPQVFGLASSGSMALLAALAALAVWLDQGNCRLAWIWGAVAVVNLACAAMLAFWLLRRRVG